jgi:hypothetical protein
MTDQSENIVELRPDVGAARLDQVLRLIGAMAVDNKLAIVRFDYCKIIYRHAASFWSIQIEMVISEVDWKIPFTCPLAMPA